MRLSRAALAAALCLCAALSWGERFSYSADSMTGAMGKGKERVILQGRAVVRTGSMVIQADKIELYGEDFRYADCTGKVSVNDSERGIALSTEKLLYDRKDKISRLTGPSVMEDKKNRVVVKGDYIEHDEGRDLAIIQVNVRILKDEISCRSEFARFDRRSKLLELSGAPSVKRGKDEYKARLIVVNLDTEDIQLEGAVSGTVSGDTKKKAEPDKPGTGASSADKPAAGEPQSVNPVPEQPSGGKAP